MKVRLLIPINLEGKAYDAGSQPDIPAREAKALIRGGYAAPVVTKTVETAVAPEAEKRAD